MHLLLLLFFMLVPMGCMAKIRYTPDWPSLDSRPIPAWYDKAKFGVFMHWGPYAVPGVESEWFWYSWKNGNQEIQKFMKQNYPPRFKYQEFGSQFTAKFFNATSWVELVEASGAQYYVLTSKHHDGFTNWPSSRSFGWNAMDVGPKRDIVGELAKAFKTSHVKFGLYHSLFEWYNPMYLADKKHNFTTRVYVEEKIVPDLIQLIMEYYPEVLWSDGDWEAGPKYWGSTNFLAWLYNKSPMKDTIVTNDRWGRGIRCKHGDFFTCSDRYNPGVLQKHKWENAMTVDRQSWGHRRNMKLADVLSMEELTKILAETVSCGGNLLMNVGPNKEGTIDVIFEERMREIGTWLKINGEAIYGSKPWMHQNDTIMGTLWYTMSQSTKDPKTTLVYGILVEWPSTGILELGSPRTGYMTTVSMLGYKGQLTWETSSNNTMVIHLPDKGKVRSNYAWVLKFQYLLNNSNQVWK